MHSNALNYYFANWDTVKKISNLSELNEFIIVNRAFFNNVSGWIVDADITNIDSVIIDIFLTSTNNRTRLLQLYDSLTISSIWQNTLLTAEKNFITSVMQYFNTDFSNKTNIYVFNSFIQYSDSLKQIWNTISWPNDSVNSGSLSGNFLNILKNSAEFWKDKKLTGPDTTVANPNEPNPCLTMLQADAAGYLVHWSKACYDEIKQNGKLDEANSEKRMRKAWEGACKASFLKGLRVSANKYDENYN
jgi:hypothetical protein